MSNAWDGSLQSAGGPSFGAALQAFALERDIGTEQLAQAANLNRDQMHAVFAGELRLGTGALARMIPILRSRPIEFMQKTAMLSLEVYASGLDPLYFLPDGPIRYSARIYMREINPRHPVPEADMTKRNPTLKAIAEDPLIDNITRIELELAYLILTATQHTGGNL